MTNTKRKVLRVLALALSLLPGPVSAQRKAQAETGGITGTATDALHEVLPGAALELEPGHRLASSDATGKFRFAGLAPGQYTLTTRYVGFAAATETVEVAAGATATATPELKPSSSSQNVVVTAPRAYGEAEAINTERSSDNIEDVLPEAVATSLPNANVADAVGRLPGVTLERDEGEGKYVQIRGTEPRLSNTTVDGVELQAPESGIRQVKLDVIPADLVGSVELDKTLQPDQSGDAIGGSVNLVTKTAGSAPTLTLYSSGGLTPIDNLRGAGEVGGTFGRRWGRKKDWGAILSGSYDRNGRGIDDVEPVPDALATVAHPLVDNADFRQYRYNRSRYGFGGSVDHNLGTASSVYVRGLMADFVDGGLRSVTNLDATGNGPSLGAGQRIGNYLVSSLLLGGSQQLPTSQWRLDWQISAARSRMLYPQFDNTAGFAYIGPTSQCSFNSAATTNPFLPQFAPVCFQEAGNPANFNLTGGKMGGFGQSAKLDVAARADMDRFYSWNGNPGVWKFGFAIDRTHQFDDSWQQDFAVGTDPSTGQPFAISAAQFMDAAAANADYYNGHYPAAPFAAEPMVTAYVAAHPGQFVFTSTQGHDPNNYELNESIPAFYAMDTADFGRWRATGGVRVEHTGLNTLSPDANNALTALGRFGYTDLLPSAAVQYKLDGSSDLRLAYGRGISRPIPADLTSALSEDLSVNPHRASLGNPALVPEHGDDFDLLYERYLTPLGEVRGGLFYKRLTDPLVSLQTTPTSGPFAGFRLTQPANAGAAHIAGLEFSFEQQFTYLPGALRGLRLSGNYSFTTSQANNVAPGVRSDSPRLLRQAPSTWNLSPTFDGKHVFARLGLAYNGGSIFQYNFADGAPGGTAGPSGDVYEYAHFQVDAEANLKLSPRWTLVLSGLNLNNAVFGFYQGSPQFMIQREYYQPTYSLGFRWTLGER